METFIEKPVESLENATECRKEIERLFRIKTIGLEKGLDTTMAFGGHLDVTGPIYFSRRFDRRDGLPLIVDSLVLIDQNFDVNCRERLSSVIEKADEEGKCERKEVKILREVLEMFPGSPDEFYDNYILSSSHGRYYPGSKTVLMEVVPPSIIQEISEIPHVLDPLIDFTKLSDEQSVNGTITHELTHAWLDKNSAHYQSEKIPNSIDEIFAYYTSYIISGYQFHNEDSDLYDCPEEIKWGVQLLVDKAEEFQRRGSKKTGIDFARKTQLKVYEEAVSSYSARYEVLVRACLLKEDKRRLQKFRKLDEQIEKSLGGIKHALFGDARGAVRETQLGEELENLSKEITWEDPKKMEKKILDDITKAAIEGEDAKYGGLYWVNHKITEELEKRSQMLEKYIETFEKVRKEIKNSDFRNHLKKSEKQINKLDQKLNQIIENGKTEKAELIHAPDIIANR